MHTPYTPTTIEVRVRGLSPLLMDNPEGKIPGAGTKKGTTKDTNENVIDLAEDAAYRLPSKQLGVPPRAFYNCTISGGKGVKYAGGGRSHLSTLMTRALMDVTAPDRMMKYIPLVFDNDDPITEYEIDARPIGLDNGGKAMKYRPLIWPWDAVLRVQYVVELANADLVVDAMARGGITCGILSFRPEKKGPFGRFQVVEWHLKEEDPYTGQPAVR